MTQVIEAFKKGHFIIVVDDKDRENEGDLVMAAQHITAEKVNFMLTYGKGLITVPLTKNRLKELELHQMVEKNEEYTKCAFTVSVDARHGISSGISATDRANTISLLANPHSSAQDFVKPGHMFPLQAADGLLKERNGHTEAALELCKRACLEPVAVLCEILDDKGEVMRGEDLDRFAQQHNLQMISVKDLENA